MSKKALDLLILMALPLATLLPAPVVHFLKSTKSHVFLYPKSNEILVGNCLYFFIILVMIFLTYGFRHQNKMSLSWIKRLLQLQFFIQAAIVFVEIGLLFYTNMSFGMAKHLPFWSNLSTSIDVFEDNIYQFIPLFLLFIPLILMYSLIRKKQFNEEGKLEDTSGNFGTAQFASEKDLKALNAYDPNNGPLIGVDEKGNSLYLPLYNKLVISPEGGGKTSSSSIPVLLSHKGPVVVFDPKGELWAVTARHRSKAFGKQVVTIDPFNIIQGKDFSFGKPDYLLKKYTINPFDFIPENEAERDRMINEFAASFIINEGGAVTHFDDNAKILIRGYVDFLMKGNLEGRNLPNLYNLLSESYEEARMTLSEMKESGGRAAAAANQIERVGSDERGSILSTTYRQIDWISDSNIQTTLTKSNFDLKEFLAGSMDIFVIIPEDQTQEHNRLFRMLMSLLMGMIIKSEPCDLPEERILFLLEELAQLGGVPDVEKCIEVLRARGIRIWTVFQALSQIELYDKPDLFKSLRLKQFFANDDPDTMEWIKTLGGQKTVLTKTLSTNSGDSRQQAQLFGGTVSKGEGESVHETGVDLIPMNKIRELPIDEQYVFLRHTKAIHCRKVQYIYHPDFAGKFDPNPLEGKKVLRAEYNKQNPQLVEENV